MTTTIFTSGTTIASAWLNDVNTTTYTALGSGGTAPSTAAQVRINLDVPKNTDLAASSGSALVGFIQSGTGAVTRTAQSKMRETVSVADFGAVGNGVADDTSVVQTALTSGAAIVRGVPGATYLVSHVGTVTVNSTAQRYCLLLPTGVIFDLNGSTLKAANASNSTPIMLYNLTDAGVINGVIDCNKSNQTTPASGEIAGIYAYGCTRPIIENIRAKNCRMYAGRFLGNTGGRYRGLWCTDSDADGWSFGIDGGFSGHIVEAQIDDIYAENCTQVYGGGYQGNPAIFCVKRCTVGKVIGKYCSGGIKVQDSSADSSFAEMTFIGQTNGTNNSGVKVQGNGAGLQPVRIKVGSVNVSNSYGNGLYIVDSLSVQVAEYHGISNGTGAGATGSNQHDINIDVPSGGRVVVGMADSETPAAQIGRALGAGYCKIGTLLGKTPTGIGFSYSGTGEFDCEDMRINDGGSGMTYAFVATGGKGHIKSISTDKAHSTTQSRVTVQSGLYDWTIDRIRLGSTDVLEGVVQLTNTATSTAVTCGHIWTDYVGGTADNFQPIIAIEPMRGSTMTLGTMRAVSVSGGTGTGLSIKHAAAGASDYVFWKVLAWKTGSQAMA